VFHPLIFVLLGRVVLVGDYSLSVEKSEKSIESF